MSESKTVSCIIKEPIELNLSYMPFIKGGGLFVPSFDEFKLGDAILINLLLPGKKNSLEIEGKVIWITPKNALHHVIPGIGVQFTSVNAAEMRAQIENNLDNTMEIGGYTYGITDDLKNGK